MCKDDGLRTGGAIVFHREPPAQNRLDVERVMPREDIITSLMAPENTSLLKSHLGIHVDVEPALADLVE
jgi:hypothetical protein